MTCSQGLCYDWQLKLSEFILSLDTV